jgi:hypothetical protein
MTRLLVAATAAVMLSVSLHGGQVGSPREVGAARTPRPPVIDGEPSESEWSAAPEISDFIQQEPDTGLPPTEKTVVRVLYDDDSIYVAAWLHDSAPITARLARRDSDLASDWFAVYLDADHDHRNALMFAINPAGVMRDAFVDDDFEDAEWNAVWDAAAAAGATGWTAEIRIPLSQLRFAPAPSHVWGINFHREIARRNEHDRLVHLPRNESGLITRLAHLVGIEGVSPKRRLEILPYAAVRNEWRGDVIAGDPFAEASSFGADAGLDLKYGLASNLTLTATLNPDFGQVELDPAQINLTEFELFYPERRPFFLEGADLFFFSAAGADVFYSRRIGRAPQLRPSVPYDFIDIPSETKIAGALKLTGKTRNGLKIAALAAVTNEQRAFFSRGEDRGAAVVEPATSYLVARFGKEIGADSGIGAIVTGVVRANPGELRILRDRAWAAGVDGYRFFGRRDYALEWSAVGSRIEGSTASIEAAQRSPVRNYQRTDSRGLSVDPTRTSLSGWNARGIFYKRTGTWRYRVTASGISPGLELNDAGFLSRSDQLTTSASIVYSNPNPWRSIRSQRISGARVGIWNFDHDLLVNRYLLTGFATLMNYVDLSLGLKLEDRVLDDRATRGGPLAAAPRRWHVDGGLSSDSRRKLVVSAGGQIERDEMGGSVKWVDGAVAWNPATNVKLSVAPSYQQRFDRRQYLRTVVDDTAPPRYVFGDIQRKTVSLGTRLDWSFSSRLSFQLYVEPFVSSGDYTAFKELARTRSFDFATYGPDAGSLTYDPATNAYTIDPDLAGPAAPFTMRNPDFNFRSLRGNAVVRWEFRPGSSIYFAWNESRAATEPFGDFDAGRDLGALSGLPSDDVFLIKVSYWIGL